MAGSIHERRVRGGRGALTAVLVAVALVAAGCDWAQWGAGPGHGFANPGEAALDVGSLEASHQVTPGGRVLAPIVVGAAMVASSIDLPAGTAEVHAWDTGSGAVRWTARLDGAARDVTAVGASGSTVVVGWLTSDSAMHVRALDRATGATQWTTDVPAPTITPPAVTARTDLGEVLTITGGRAYLTDRVDSYTDPYPVYPSKVTLRSFDLLTGAVRSEGAAGSNTSYAVADLALSSDGWLAEVFSTQSWRGPGSPYVDEHTLSAAPLDGSSTGWSFDASAGQVAASWVIAAGRYLVTDPAVNEWFDGPWPTGVVVRRSTTGEIVGGDEALYGAPSAADSGLAIWSSTEQLDARKVPDLGPAWTAALPSGTTSAGPLTIAGPLVYVVTASASGSTLRTFDRATGAPESTLAVPSPSTTTTGLPRPIVANGRVFLVVDGTVHVYEPA